MGIGISEEHVALGAAVRRFLEKNCPPAVVRAGIEEGGSRSLPPFWEEMAALGWLGLHVPEESGGQGYTLIELGVVSEEMGRVCAPGPFLPAVLASSLVTRGGTEALKAELLPLLAAGGVAAVGLPGSGALRGARHGSDLRVEGRVRPILDAAGAPWSVLPVQTDGGEVWCAFPPEELAVSAVASLDPTRPLVEVAVDGVDVPPDQQLELSGAEARALMAAITAAECVGGARWCLETAVEHAKVREQFGRPIGQFQAIKHKCADMLVSVEQAQAVSWAALRAMRVDSGSGDPDAELAAAAAGAVAAEAFCRVAKDCVQILGGVGFTWEHDAHLYLRRAMSVRQLLGGTSAWRRRVADLALAGARHRVGVDLGPESGTVRESVRAEVLAVAALPEAERRRALVEAGLFVAHWSKPWGRDAGPVEQLVIDEELKRAGIRRPHLAVGAWAAPTIAVHGTEEQQERWVRPTLLGEIHWCQLFSEPGAGSDLASLTTKATRVDGGWSLSGQKVWTSLAAEADWGICLARTNPGAAKHLGITYFVVDMHGAGIEIRPLKELTGNAMFNEVFLDDVFVPDGCVIGEVDGGWALARTTLANERVAMGSGTSFGGGVEALLALAVAGAGSGADIDAVALDGLGALVAEAHSVALLGQRTTEKALTGAAPGSESSVRKLLAAEHDQRVQEFGLSLLGGEGATADGTAAQWAFGFLANRCLTIAGGTSEVQRNVIGERLLGLPRDPEP
ncbi:MAG TPA: acyl-CoA dehydrogenase [Acidimicrobiales bacterium]|nr:acyl-CoA dehydrogenase [Acidimicrobiales bacterium]